MGDRDLKRDHPGAGEAGARSRLIDQSGGALKSHSETLGSLVMLTGGELREQSWLAWHGMQAVPRGLGVPHWAGSWSLGSPCSGEADASVSMRAEGLWQNCGPTTNL